MTVSTATVHPASTPATKALGNASLLKMVPSIFTDRAHRSRSERYAHLPTIDVIERLRKAGFVPVQAFESRIHKNVKERAPFTKHLVRLREKRWVDADLKLDAVIPDIILTNSHDGSSSFQLEAGLYRLVCSNGMVVRSNDFGSIRVAHSGKIVEKVKEAAENIIEHVPAIMRATKEWDKIKLTTRQQSNFAKQALAIRFHGEPPITIEQALEVRRTQDEAPTLWRTFNVLQENLLTGGQSGRSPTGRAVRTKLVTSVNNSLLYNRNLWLLAETIAEKH